MFAEIEQTILDRLRAKLGDEITVKPERDLERAGQRKQFAPAVWVINNGYSVADRITTGVVQQVNQEWLLVVATKSARGNGDAQAARDEASKLCEQVLEALLGFHLGDSIPALRGKYLHLSDAGGPEYDAGYCEVPLAFTNAATFKGKP